MDGPIVLAWKHRVPCWTATDDGETSTQVFKTIRPVDWIAAFYGQKGLMVLTCRVEVLKSG
jgi:hypothetical protein